LTTTFPTRTFWTISRRLRLLTLARKRRFTFRATSRTLPRATLTVRRRVTEALFPIIPRTVIRQAL